MVHDSVALIGSGLIGRGWAILFARAGYRVRLHDSASAAVDAALGAIAANVRLLEAERLVDDGAALLSRIEPAATLAGAVDGAFYAQESVTEDEAVKRGVFAELGQCADPGTILASSCSTIPPARFMDTVAGPERCIIAHPFSPPHLVPLVEIVLAPATRPSVADETMALMRAIGQRPVLIHKPVVGFAVNRLQAVVINEAMGLVRDGVISPGDLDLCMSEGLGRRWAFMGPFETMELNAHDGFKDYATRYSGVYRSILDDIDTGSPWDEEAISRIEAWRREGYPTRDEVTERRLWRDRMLMTLGRFLSRASADDAPADRP